MNPYEAPQSSLEPEKRPSVSVQYEQYDTRALLKIVFVSLLVLSEAIMGVVLLFRLAVALGFYPGSDIETMDKLLP